MTNTQTPAGGNSAQDTTSLPVSGDTGASGTPTAPPAGSPEREVPKRYLDLAAHGVWVALDGRQPADYKLCEDLARAALAPVVDLIRAQVRVAVELSVQNLRAEYGDVAADRADDTLEAHLRAALADGEARQ